MLLMKKSHKVGFISWKYKILHFRTLKLSKNIEKPRKIYEFYEYMHYLLRFSQNLFLAMLSPSTGKF